MGDWFDAERHAERARDHYESGDWRRALRELRRAVKINPDKPEWFLGLGRTLDHLGRHEDAIAAYQRVRELRGDDPDTLVHLGIDLAQIGQVEQAIETLEAAAVIDPMHEASYCHRIHAYTLLDEHDQAEHMFYLARQLVEHCPRCYDYMAQSLAIRDEMPRAVWCWQQTLKLDPTFPNVRANLAEAHWRLGDRSRARRLFIRQLRMTPGDLEVLLRLSTLLIEMGRASEAAEKLRRVLELDPTNADAHAELGELSLAAGHLDAATRWFRRALRHDERRPGVHLGLARAALRRDDAPTAHRHAKHEAALPIHTTAQTLELSRIFIETGDPEAALLRLDGLFAGGSFNGRTTDELPVALLHRGVARIVLGETRAGRRDCYRSHKLEPGDGAALHNVVLACLELGELTRAKAALRRLRLIRPNTPALRSLNHALRRKVLGHWLGRFRLGGVSAAAEADPG